MVSRIARWLSFFLILAVLRAEDAAPSSGLPAVGEERAAEPWLEAQVELHRRGFSCGGIHGTPDPEHVGRTESHGCFRLANWGALTLLGLVRTGMPVVVEP